MTRRRALALVVAVLTLVFLIGSILTINGTRDQLVDNIDADLANQLDLNQQFYNAFTVAALDDFDVLEHPLAIVILDDVGAVQVEILAGSVSDPLPAPDLPPSQIIERVGERFTVDGTAGGPSYRVAVGRLDDGQFLAIAAPLDEVGRTVGRLARTLLVTLFAMMVVPGVIFALLLRASMRPYAELVDTAEAIADGDMNRRATQTSRDPGIERLTNSLNIMLDRLQAALEERQAAENSAKLFSADASHELRTPISTIAGYSEVYLSGAATDTESVDKQMTRINSEAHRMGRLVNHLLTLARLDQGQGLEFRPLDVRSLVADAVADAQTTDPSHDIDLTSAGSAASVMGDRDALHQVCVNLISNTRLHAPGAHVEVSVSSDDAHVTITVVDDGPGMAAGVAERSFDRFYRAEESRSSSVRSSGLGLSIVAAIVAAHGGTIDVVSTPGVGSTFTVVLPTVRGADAQNISS